MAIIKSRIIFLAGFIFLVTGLGRAYADWHFSLVANVSVLIGLVLLVLFGFFRFLNIKNSLKWGRLRKKIFVFVGVVCVLILYGLINYFAVISEKRFDLTRSQQHTLEEESLILIDSLEQNIQLTVFFVGEHPKYLEDILKEYERRSNNKIVTEIIDPLVQIGYASQFGQVISGKESKLIVQSEGERYDVDFSDKFLNEELINNGLLQVTREARIACFVSGHGEYSLYDSDDQGLNTFVRHLLANNIMVQELLLGNQEEVPASCQILVVAGPQEHLDDEEIDKLQAYLEKGGDAFFMIENTVVSTPDNPLTDDQITKNPSLNKLFQKWGLSIESDIVVDLKSHASGDVGSPATRNYMAHKAIVGDLDYTFYVRPRSIRMLRDKPESVKLAPLVMTSSSETSWGETNRYLNIKFNPELDRPGPVPLAFVVWEPKESKEDKISDTRIVVFTDADFVSNAYIGAYNNAKMGVNVLNWLSEKDYETFLVQEDIEIVKLELTSHQKRTVVLILIGMLLSIAVFGLFIWME